MEDKGKVRDGRPRWMVEEMDGDFDRREPKASFQDGDEEESPPPRPRRQRIPEDKPERREHKANGTRRPEKVVDLDPMEDQPARRPQAAPKPKPTPRRPKTPEPLRQRTLVAASSTTARDRCKPQS